MADQQYDVIVIGAGFGGSACAGLLAKRGLKVLLAEKNSRAGGKAMSLSKNGFTYTAWVVIGAPVDGNLYQVVLDELGVQDRATLVVPGVQGSMYKRSNGEYMRLPEMPAGQVNPNVLFDWLEIKEEDRAGALQFFMDLTLMPPEEIDKLHDISFQEWVSRYNPPGPLYAFVVGLCCDGMFMVPVDTLEAAESIKSLQDMFLRNGGVFCLGGYGQVAEAYCDGVRKHGGTVLMRNRTEKIIVEEGRAKGVVTSGGTFYAPIVISNAGIQPTVLKLAGEQHFAPDYVQYVKDLVPSLSLLGYRYFLNKRVFDVSYGVIFSQETPWSRERFEQACAGKAPREGVVYYEVPSEYDPNAAPAGKQIVLTGSFCPPDPDMSKEDIAAWADTGEQILFQAFPALEDAIEDKDLYTTREVSHLTRDAVLPGIGGETIGLGQIVGQCGPGKPSIKSPLEGLYYVGCDAGGTGVGTQQAIESGMNVAEAVFKALRG